MSVHARGLRRTNQDAVQAKSWFFVIMAAVMLALIFWGFAPTFFLRPLFGRTDYVGAPQMPIHVLVHGLLLSAWYVLFLAQSWLALTRRVHMHKRLGIAAVVLAITILPLSAYTIGGAVLRLSALAAQLQMPKTQLEAAVGGLVAGDSKILFLFGVFVLAAVLLRHDPSSHKRLMLFASLWLMGPAFAVRPVGPGQPFVSIFPAWFGSSYMLLAFAALVLHDAVSRRRLETATFWIGLTIACSYGLAYVTDLTDFTGAVGRWVT